MLAGDMSSHYFITTFTLVPRTHCSVSMSQSVLSGLLVCSFVDIDCPWKNKRSEGPKHWTG